MPLIKTDIELGKYLNDKNRSIPLAHLDVVCKRSTGPSACRYICSVGLPENQVFVCVKNTPLKPAIDKEATTNPAWKAKGDNCDGFGENE